MITNKRKHQWIYDLSTERINYYLESSHLAPAEKRTATKILKERNGIFKAPSPAQRRALLLGQYKFFLTGMQGQINTLDNASRSAGNYTDLNLGERMSLAVALKAVKDALQSSMQSVERISLNHKALKEQKASK